MTKQSKVKASKKQRLFVAIVMAIIFPFRLTVKVVFGAVELLTRGAMVSILLATFITAGKKDKRRKLALKKLFLVAAGLEPVKTLLPKPAPAKDTLTSAEINKIAAAVAAKMPKAAQPMQATRRPPPTPKGGGKKNRQNGGHKSNHRGNFNYQEPPPMTQEEADRAWEQPFRSS